MGSCKQKGYPMWKVIRNNMNPTSFERGLGHIVYKNIWVIKVEKTYRFWPCIYTTVHFKIWTFHMHKPIPIQFKTLFSMLAPDTYIFELTSILTTQVSETKHISMRLEKCTMAIAVGVTAYLFEHRAVWKVTVSYLGSKVRPHYDLKKFSSMDGTQRFVTFSYVGLIKRRLFDETF